MYSYRAIRFIFVCSFLFGWGLLGSAPTTQTSFPQPSFATPPLFAVHGPNVGMAFSPWLKAISTMTAFQILQP